MNDSVRYYPIFVQVYKERDGGRERWRERDIVTEREGVTEKCMA